MNIEHTDKFNALKEAAAPLMQYLIENHHPHVSINVTSHSLEVLEGIMSIPHIYLDNEYVESEAKS